jgi:hypothetical protein
MCLGPDEITISKLDNMELREITGTTRSNLNSNTMRLGPDELTISKLDNMELREITGTTRSNINSRIQI